MRVSHKDCVFNQRKTHLWMLRGHKMCNLQAQSQNLTQNNFFFPGAQTSEGPCHPKRPLSQHASFFIYMCTLLAFPFWPAGGAVVLVVFLRASPEVFSPGSFCLLPVHSCVRKDNSSPESGTSGTETQHQQIHTPVLSVNGSQVPSTVPGKVSG